MKTFTDLEQSKKLAEFLPLESADMFWYKDAVTKEANPRIMNYMQVPELQSIYYSPCWSLAALLNILPNYHVTNNGITGVVVWSLDTYSKEHDNPVDACYEIILKLDDNNLL